MISPIAFDTLHVNLWGIPGTGKSGLACELNGRLNKIGILSELVREYAKELAWAGVLARRDENGDLIEVDQLLISAEQYRREDLVHGKVRVSVTDSPVLAGILYAKEEDEPMLRDLLRRRTNGWNNLDVLLERDLTQSYESRGRIQSLEESLATRPRLHQLLAQERPHFIRMHVDTALERLMVFIAERLQQATFARSTFA